MKKATIIGIDREENTTVFRNGDTLDDLLDYLGIQTSNADVTVNGAPAYFDAELEDGDVIKLTSKKQTSGAA